VEGVHDFRASTVIERDDKIHSRIGTGELNGAIEICLNGVGQVSPAADDGEADIVFVNGGQFPLQVFAEQPHQELDFGLRAARVPAGEDGGSETGKFQASGSLDCLASRFNTPLVARSARQTTPLSPAAVTIHDDRNVARKAVSIDFFEKLGFLPGGGLPEVVR